MLNEKKSLCEDCENCHLLKIHNPKNDNPEYVLYRCLINSDITAYMQLPEITILECNKFIRKDRIEYCDDPNCGGHLVKKNNLIKPCNE